MATTTFNPQTTDDRKSKAHLDKAKEAGNEALDKAKEAGNEAVEAAKGAGAEALDKAKEVGADVLGKAKDAAASVGEFATHTACAVGQKAENLTAAAGHEIKEFGETIAKKAPHEGLTGGAAQAVAGGIKTSGQYIEDAKLTGMAHDVEQVIKSHPIPALLVCLGIGFCLGRMMKD